MHRRKEGVNKTKGGKQNEGGKQTDGAFLESFSGKARAECIGQNGSFSQDHARSKREADRREYNEERPHSATGNKTPIALIKSVG